MIVRKIEFNRFRNLADTAAEFSEGVNVLRGQNAQGKSNILEGVYLFARGRSFRGSKAREMLQFGEESAAVRMSFARDGDKHDTQMEIRLFSDNSRQYFRRGAQLKNVREMIGNFRAVLFCPLHLELAGGAPAVRRSYLDIALSQLSPVYIDDLTKYRRLLLHRNSLLREAALGHRAPSAEWESFAMLLAAYGARIAAARLRYTRLASMATAEVFGDMTAGAEHPEMVYSSAYFRTSAAELLSAEAEKPLDAALDSRIADGICRLYTDHIDREIKLGSTMYGIHKDDIDITLNGKDSRLYASQGQMRSIALAMKLAEGELCREISGEYPVFLLDDVLSELDSSRRSYVLSSLKRRQIIITSCDADLFADYPGVRIIGVEQGRIAD